jgi:hypothetical protein
MRRMVFAQYNFLSIKTFEKIKQKQLNVSELLPGAYIV